MAKKKTSKKTETKAERQRRWEANRGSRTGRKVRSVQMRLPDDLVEWLDASAHEVHLNRTQFVVMLLEAARKFDGAMETSGLFADMEQHIEGAVLRALQSMPRPDLERLLAKKKT